MFIMMGRRDMPKTQASTLNVEVTLRGQGQNEYYLIGLLFPVHISTMHHRISKKLGTNVYHDEAACRAQDPGLYIKCQGHT